MTIKLAKFGELSDEAILLLKAGDINFFSSFFWYKNWINSVVLAKNEKVQFLNYIQDGDVKLLIPLKSNGKSLESLANYYSPLFQVVSCLENKNDLFLEVFFKELKKSPYIWDTIVLRPMKQDYILYLSSYLKEIGLPNIPFFCFANWYLEVKFRSYDQYFSTLSSRVKNTVIRKTKQFYKLKDTRVEIITESKDLDKGIADFETVYALSWKGDETYPDFISGLIKTASEHGALRLGVAYLNNTPVAAQLWIVADNSAYIYKLAYDEKHKKLSAGSILTATLMRYVIDIDKVAHVDYLSGDDRYKKEWMSHRRERWGIMIFNRHSMNGCFKMCNEYARFYFKKIVSK